MLANIHHRLAEWVCQPFTEIPHEWRYSPQPKSFPDLGKDTQCACDRDGMNLSVRNISLWFIMCKGQIFGETAVFSFVMVFKSQCFSETKKSKVTFIKHLGMLLGKSDFQVSKITFFPPFLGPWFTFDPKTAKKTGLVLRLGARFTRFFFFIKSMPHIQGCLLPHLSQTSKMLPKDLMVGYWLVVKFWWLVIEFWWLNWSNPVRICPIRFLNDRHKTDQRSAYTNESRHSSQISILAHHFEITQHFFTRCESFGRLKTTNQEAGSLLICNSKDSITKSTLPEDGNKPRSFINSSGHRDWTIIPSRDI